ncbi:PTS sugar transporter subunit IIA [Gulosibacter molinativorax]|uniref:Ascorbate-specific PTS system EIIA component n=1 Tax=Gulosibacter molinativorax TaxID=256821 RepID=A0ABT7C810_9MICO|nr:PTS sugar transporter subunit IIA [Gulosibacter molinativorax]MDJ1371343.1 PTS ascorbate transporter subunit IIA [Gulosibacter molinativorax]QUY63593.1 PTS ascorbate transporter subunit IIA [Gulosibacter molinativorax]
MNTVEHKLHFDESMVRRGAKAANWRSAVEIAGELLVRARCVRPGYTKKLIDVIDKFGPYIVIAPGLALVHAQPSADSLQRGLVAVTFPDGVNFGHAHYDPVGLVVAISTMNPAQHLGVVAGIANGLDGDATLVSKAVRSGSDAELVELIKSHLPDLNFDLEAD